MTRIFILGLLACGCATPDDFWRANLSADRTGAFVHAERTYTSSSSLRITWSPPDASVHHYSLSAAESRSSTETSAAGDARDHVLTGLKAGTPYTIRLRACLDENCGTSLAADQSVQAATEEEYWRIQGKGESFATADRLVPDGNVGSHAIRYGAWAGPELDGKIQLYYTPQQASEKGIKIGEMVASNTGSIEAASAFRGVSGYGMLRVCQAGPPAPGAAPPPNVCDGSKSLATNLALYQAVPLGSEAGRRIRMFFEAQGYDGRTRIFYVDSQDGYVGRDFHRGAPTQCTTVEDYSTGGGCEPTLAIGVDVDGDRGNLNLRNARQFKIGYPLVDSWVWDMSPGTYMWFTTEWPDRRCSDHNFNAAYAVWNGSNWVVDYREDGCPKVLAGAQAPAPVHLGGARYKLYFNRHPRPGGPMDPQVALKPMRMIYADPGFSGNNTTVEFEDWEPLDSARRVNYLWATGRLLTDDENSRLDDYQMFAPGDDPSRLIMYSNMSAGGQGALPFIGSAVLVNP